MTDYSTVVLDLPGSDGRFKFQGDVEFTPQGRFQFTKNSGNGVTALAEKVFGAPEKTSLKANAYLGVGQGVRKFTIRFTSWTGESKEFGALGSDATAAEKMLEFEHQLANREIDSRNPATLIYGDLHPEGRFAPVDVVIPEYDFTFAVGEGETVNTFTGEMTLVEAFDVNIPLHPAEPFE